MKEEKNNPKTEPPKTKLFVDNSNNSTKAPNSELSLSAQQQTNNQQLSSKVEDTRTKLQTVNEKQLL